MSKKYICQALIKPHSAKITSQIKRNSKRTCQLYVYTHEHELYKFMHLRADNNVIQLLLTILFCCVRDDVEEKIGENEQSELTLSLFPSSKQLERWEEAPEQRECVPNSCLSHWQVRKLDTCLTRQSHGGRQKKQRNEHQINVHIIRTTVLFAFPNICSSHPQLIVAEQMILFLFIQTAKKQTLKVFDELRLGILKTRGSTQQAWG